ncbi:MAG: hypothetical protein K9K38_12925 [Rhodoferax sp.]|nr:hypothetical protein [Rhodoferax sp.]MCF8210281.1 hypothetical protein [Rhodoferax sp.]
MCLSRVMGGALALSAVLAAGCTSQTMFASTQAWQRNECQKLQDKSERDRCLASNKDSYEDFKKQADGVKKD